MSAPVKHRFNVENYYRMAETGVLQPDARVELLEGEIIDMSPIGPFHGSVVARLVRFFNRASGDRWLIWPQNAVRLDEYSEPQPDVALLKPSLDDYANRLPGPRDIFLLIEVSDTMLTLDRDRKLLAYSRSGIVEVWIVNLIEATIEVYREPQFTGYGLKTILRAGDKVVPQALPDVAVDLEQLLRR